jgi:hypothetical protein
MAKGSGQLVSVLIVGVVLFFGYQYIQGHGGIQGLIDKLKGLGGGLGGGSTTGTTATPCQGKDPTGAACDCSASTGNVGDVVVLPPFSVSNASNVAYATKKTATKAPAKGAAKTPKGGGATPAASTGTCDCSGCTGASAPAGGGGNTWQQTPGTPACNLLGQSCPTVGATGGTSGWCTCQAGGGGGTTTKASTKGTTKTTKSTKGGGTNTATTTAGLAHALLAGAELDYGFHEPHVGPSRNAYVPRYFSNVGYSN